MNNDINSALMAFVPIFRAYGEDIETIEAVRNWYRVGDKEYYKEVAEIIYYDGRRMYADIKRDSYMATINNVIDVTQGIKPQCENIERIERNVCEAAPNHRVPEE